MSTHNSYLLAAMKVTTTFFSLSGSCSQIVRSLGVHQTFLNASSNAPFLYSWNWETWISSQDFNSCSSLTLERLRVCFCKAFFMQLLSSPTNMNFAHSCILSSFLARLWRTWVACYLYLGSVTHIRLSKLLIHPSRLWIVYSNKHEDKLTQTTYWFEWNL